MMVSSDGHFLSPKRFASVAFPAIPRLVAGLKAKMNLDINPILSAGKLSGKPTKDEMMTVLTPRLAEWATHPRYATATLSALGKRRPQLVELVLECMQDARVEANVYHYSVAITASEKSADWAMALHFLGSMQQLSIEANEYSYSAAISAAEKGANGNKF